MRPIGLMKKLLILAFTVSAFAQEYKLEPISTPAPGLPPAYSAVIENNGYRVVGPKGPWCEVWLRKSIPAGAKSGDAAIVLPIGQGTLLGILRFPANGQDRREQQLKAGVYTMRYSNYPVDGAHQGVAPQRDFTLLTPIANDADPAATPDFAKLVGMSRTSGNPHPAVLLLQAPGGATFPSVSKQGEDVVLNVKSGDLGIGFVVVGKAEA